MSQYFYIQPELKLHFYNGRFDEAAAMLLGGKTGWVFNEKFVFGFCGYGKITPSTYYGYYEYTDKTTGLLIKNQNQKMRVGYGYGGLYLGMITNPYKAVHLSFGSVIGGGSSNEYIIQDNGSHGTTFGSPGFLIVEPNANIELNLTKKIRFEIGIGYRYISDLYFKSLTTKELSGMTLNMALKLGYY